jgi:aspartyl-tRNA(Asn)/glutamyl-tRNA(Gln) amidotransferase subunit B
VRPAGTTTLGTKAEVKNVNSFRYLQKAIEFEIGRQIDVLEQGGRVVQETRLFDAAQGKTYSMRSKEEAHDYRYFPDPDLPPLVVSSTRLEEARAALPELPDARRARLMTQFGLPAYDADVLTQSKELADYFEATASASGLPKAASNWVMGEVLRTMKERVVSVADVPITPEALARLLRLVDAGTISSTVAKDVFATMYETGRAADEIVASEGLAQVSDTSAIEPHVMAVLAGHPDVVAEIRAGKDRKFQFLVGQVMKASKGKADPKVVTDLLMRAIG